MHLARHLARITVVATGLAALGACFGSSSSGGSGGGTGIQNKATQASYAAAASDALAFLPADSEIVLGLDMQQVLGSPLWKRYGDGLMASIGKELSEFKAACGYDPFATMRTMAMGVKVGAGDNPEGVFVVHGLDRDKTMACIPRMPSKGGRTPQIEGGVVVVPGKGADDYPMALTFVDASTAVFAMGPQMSRATLEAQLAAGAPLRKSRAFSELWSGIDSKQTMWVVMNGSSKAFDALASMGARPKSVIGSLSLANGLSATGRLRFDSPDQATQLAGMVQGQLGMVKTMVEEVEVAADGPDLTLKLGMSVQQIEQMVGMLGGMLGGGGGFGGP
jgi:hypothetical protein